MSRSPQCYIPSFMEISPGFEEDFYPFYGRGGHLGHVTQMLRTNFCSPYPWRLHTKFDFDWLSSFGDGVKIQMDIVLWLYYKLKLT